MRKILLMFSATHKYVAQKVTDIVLQFVIYQPKAIVKKPLFSGNSSFLN